jgi:hypothetical protein
MSENQTQPARESWGGGGVMQWVGGGGISWFYPSPFLSPSLYSRCISWPVPQVYRWSFFFLLYLTLFWVHQDHGCMTWSSALEMYQLPLSFTFHYPCPLYISCTKPVASVHQRYRLTCIQGASADDFFLLSSYLPCSPDVSADLCVRCVSWPVHQVYELTCASGVSADLFSKCTYQLTCAPGVSAYLYCTSKVSAAVILLLFSTLVSCYLVHQLFKLIFSSAPWRLLQVRSSRNQVKTFWNPIWRLLYSYFTCSCFAILYILSKLKPLCYGV